MDASVAQAIDALSPLHRGALALVCVERFARSSPMPLGTYEEMGLRAAWSYVAGESPDESPVIAAITQIEQTSHKTPLNHIGQMLLQTLRTVAGTRPAQPLIDKMMDIARDGSSPLDGRFLRSAVIELSVMQHHETTLNRDAVQRGIADRMLRR